MTGNYMWDPSTNKSFDIGVNRDSLMPLWWNGSEPLWVTLTKAKKKAYMYYWPGERTDRPRQCGRGRQGGRAGSRQEQGQQSRTE